MANVEFEQRTRTAPGSVMRYKSERPNNWCREGMALADDFGRLVDTYWESMGEAHVLTEAEITTAELLFNIGDYEELPRHAVHSWKDYHPDQRQVITSQHGLRRRLFVLKGAEPDLGTRIENAKEAIRQAEREVESAKSRLEWRRDDLARLTEPTP